MRKKLTGTVTSDKMDKSLRVEIGRLYRHAQYGKIVRGRTVCYVHDEQEQSGLGDNSGYCSATRSRVSIARTSSLLPSERSETVICNPCR